MDFAPLLASPVSPAIAGAARYLASLAPGDALPRRQDFRPTRVPALLGYYFLIEVLDGGVDYHFDLAGEHMSLLFGLDVGGMNLSAIGDDELRRRLKATYDDVVASGSFLYTRGRYRWPERVVDIERLLVPMANRDGALRSILGISIPDLPLGQLNLLAGVGAASLEIETRIGGKTSA
jgi:hypothetical protein